MTARPPRCRARARVDPAEVLGGNWRQLPGLEDRYYISDDSRVWSVQRQKLMTPRMNRDGYLVVGITHAEYSMTKRRVHQLVLEAFVGPRPPGHVGCHNNGNPLDNRLSNLRWDSQQENMLDVSRHGRNHWALRTECPSGHPYSGGNLLMHRKKRRGREGGVGYERRCATCLRERHEKQRDSGYVRPSRRRSA